MEEKEIEKITVDEINETIYILTNVLSPLFKVGGEGLFSIPDREHNKEEYNSSKKRKIYRDEYNWKDEFNYKFSPRIGICFRVKDEKRDKVQALSPSLEFSFDRTSFSSTSAFLKSIKKQLEEELEYFSMGGLITAGCRYMTFETFNDLIRKAMERDKLNFSSLEDKEKYIENWGITEIETYLRKKIDIYKEEVAPVRQSAMTVIDYLIKLNNKETLKNMPKEAQEQENTNDER